MISSPLLDVYLGFLFSSVSYFCSGSGLGIAFYFIFSISSLLPLSSDYLAFCKAFSIIVPPLLVASSDFSCFS